MLNLSSPDFEQISEEESEEVIPGTTYTKKIKKISKRFHKVYGGNLKKKCQNYNRGNCQEGRQCLFSHSFIPDIAKKICIPYLKGQCNKGTDCFYSHNKKRYPCRDLFFTKKCSNGSNCEFSHQQIESDDEEEFLKQNQDYIRKLHSKNSKALEKKYITFINKISETEEKQKIQQKDDMAEQLPDCFWLPLKKTSLLVQNPEERSRPLMKRGRKRKSQVEKKPETPKIKGIFSIRFITKNRKELEEKLEPELVIKYSKLYRTQKLNEVQNNKLQEYQKSSSQTHPKVDTPKEEQREKLDINNVDEYML